MKARLVLALLILVVVSSCGRNYATGERMGVITKLSCKGLIFESWEGELLVALPIDVAGTTQPDRFVFNVSPPCVEKVKAAMSSGKRVTLVYRQWFVSPPTIDHSHVVIDVR